MSLQNAVQRKLEFRILKVAAFHATLAIAKPWHSDRDAIVVGTRLRQRLVLRVESALAPLAQAILAALPQADVAAVPGEVDWSVVRRVLADLEPLLALSNTRANRICAEHAGLLKVAFGVLGETLVELVGSFQYPEAQEIAHQLHLLYPQLARR